MLKEIANVDQARSWDGDDGDHWTEHEAAYNAATARHTTHLWRGAAIGADDRVLDVGCGTGETTRDAARLAHRGNALGVDLSARQLDRARERAREEGLANVRFEQADAQVHPFVAASFDVVISRTGTMFFADPVAAFANIAGAARADARLAMVTWQSLERNPWIVETREALSLGRPLPPEGPGPGPFSLSDPAVVRDVLARAGWTRIDLAPIDEPMYFGEHADAAFALLRDIGLVRGLSMALAFSDSEKQQALDRLHAMLRRHETGDGVLIESHAWLTTARRAR